MRWLSRPASATQVTHGSRLWLYALAALVLAFLTLPTLIVVPMSFSGSQYLEFPPRQWSLRWYQSYLGSASWMQATRTSFAAGGLTMLLSTPLALMAAYGLNALRGRWAAIIYAALLTPIIVPVILVGIAVFYAYVRLKLVHSLMGIVLVHSILAIPVALKVTVGRRERVLDGVLGLLGRADHVAAEREDPAVMAVVDGLERGLGAGTDQLDELVVGGEAQQPARDPGSRTYGPPRGRGFHRARIIDRSVGRQERFPALLA